MNPRDEPFAYRCGRCARCCHYRVRVNPYEIARLARCLGMTTGTFRERYTAGDEGMALRQRDNDACVFLGPEGCRVHSDRPLACRLYPLGRTIDAEGGETFEQLERHPDSKGVVTRDGTVGRFLEEQGAEPFIHAADEYFSWLRRAMTRLAAAGGELVRVADSSTDALVDLLDMDAVIAEYCAATGA